MSSSWFKWICAKSYQKKSVCIISTSFFHYLSFLLYSSFLGPEFGGAIGLMFTLANSIAVSMYLIGFVEALLDMLEQYVDGFTSILHAGNVTNLFCVPRLDKISQIVIFKGCMPV
jgi:hypothetical protein